MGEWRDEWREANRANWDERVPIHVSGEFYDVASFKGGQERLRPSEISEVGDVSGKDLLHLQCHFGIDTLSWARRGARVVGLDFSLPAMGEGGRLLDPAWRVSVPLGFPPVFFRVRRRGPNRNLRLLPPRGALCV